MQGSFDDALNDSLAALHILGIEVPKAPTNRDLDIMFEEVKDEILAIGFDEILGIPRAADPRTDLAVAVLNDAGVRKLWFPRPFTYGRQGTNAYWGDGFSDIIGLTVGDHVLQRGELLTFRITDHQTCATVRVTVAFVKPCLSQL